MQAHISVRTLGAVGIDIGGRRIGPTAGRLFPLLLFLTSRRGHVCSRRVIQELLFPDCGEWQASHNVRQLIYRLRQAGVSVDADGGIGVPADHVTVDWVDFLNRSVLDQAAMEQLSHGVFPGYSPDAPSPFRDWFEAERAEIVQRLSRSLTTQVTQLRRAGRWDLVESASRALLAIDPLSEEGTLAKAEVLAVSGSKSAALHVIDGYLKDLGDKQPHLMFAPSALRRRISERLPDMSHHTFDDRLFVGREDSMRALSALGAATRAGNQQVVLVWGEPGIGKTRLLAEYRALASLQGGITLCVSCQPHDVFRPLGMLCDLVTQLLAVPGALGCDPGARALLERLASVNKQVDGAREEAASETPLSAIVRSLGDLISAVAGECPLQLFIDDAQWLDPNSQHAILGAFAPSASRRSSLVLTSRDRALLDAAESRTAAMCSVRLQGLPQEAALELARTMLRGARGSDAEHAARQVIEQGRGNPFVIRVLCAHLASTNDSESLKQTLSEILTRRLDQLPPAARRTLEGAVILAKNCTFERLERLLETPRDRLLCAIEVLDDQGLIEVTDGFIVSSHALLAAVVVDRMAPSVRRVMHGAAGALLLAELEFANVSHAAWDCAEHLRMAGKDAEALLVLQRCARSLVAAGRHSDAVTTYERAVHLQSSDEKLLELVQEALFTCERAMTRREGAYFVDELRALRKRLGVAYRVHDAFEIWEFVLAYHEGGDLIKNIESLKQCVCADKADETHRLAAARQLLLIAEMTIDPELAQFSFVKTRMLATNAISRLYTDLMYHTIFGDREIARELAAKVAELAPLEGTRLLHSINAAYAEYRIGNSSIAVSRLLHELQLARQGGSRHGELNICLLLARLHLSGGEIGLSNEWWERCEMLRCEMQSDILCEHSICGCRIALREGRLEIAESRLRAARTSTFARLGLPKLWIWGCEVELKLARSERPCEPSALEWVLRAHCFAQSTGCYDDVMLSILDALTFYGREFEGGELLRAYVGRHRRDGYPLDNRLSIRCSDLNVSVSINGMERADARASQSPP